MVYGDPDRVNTDLGKLQAVTATQVKEVMNRYITGKKKTVIEYLPQAQKTAPPGPPASSPAPPAEKQEKQP